MNHQSMAVYRQLSQDSKTLLGLMGFGATDLDPLVESATALCPAPSVVESVECLLAEAQRLNCPQGKRIEALENFCRNTQEMQKGLLDRLYRFSDHYIEFVSEITAGTPAVSLIEFWKEEGKTAVDIGTTNLGKAKLEKNFSYTVSALQLQYGQGASRYDTVFGQLVSDASTTSGVTTTKSRVDFPTRVASGVFGFFLGDSNGQVMPVIPVRRFLNYSYEQNAIGFVKLDNTIFIPGEIKIYAKIDLNQLGGWTPPAVGGSNQYFALTLHGVGIIKA